MSTTLKRFPKPSPQPWKLEVPRPLDLEEEFNPSDEVTSEFHITEPDDYMRAFDEEADTSEWPKLDEAE